MRFHRASFFFFFLLKQKGGRRHHQSLGRGTPAETWQNLKHCDEREASATEILKTQFETENTMPTARDLLHYFVHGSRVLCEKVRESVRLQVVVLCQLGRSQCYTSAGMASREGTQILTDVESDVEFDEMTSDELFPFYFGDKVDVVRDAITLQLSKKRLDRVEKILEILAADESRAHSLHNANCALLWRAFSSMPVGECSELLRIIFRYGGDGFSLLKREIVVTQAVFYKDDASLDTLREFLGNRFVSQRVKEEQKRIRSRPELLSASLRGAVAEVKRLLDLAGVPTWPDTEWSWLRFEALLPFALHEDGLGPIIGAADLGHTAVVNTLLASSTRRHRLAFGCFNLKGVFSIACRRSNYEMAANMLSTIDITRILGEDTRACLCDCVEGTPEFLRDILSLIRSRLSEANREFNSLLSRDMLNFAILHKGRHHVGVLLDEIDQHRSLFDEYPWNMKAILRSRSAAILRDVLIRYPEAPTDNADCDPLVAIQDYHWPVGARLLVESGAKIQGKIPPKFARLLSLSFEDKCRIAVRRHMKLPLAQNVDRLPLPGKVKRRLLYR